MFLAHQWSYYIDFPDFVHTSSRWKNSHSGCFSVTIRELFPVFRAMYISWTCLFSIHPSVEMWSGEPHGKLTGWISTSQMPGKRWTERRMWRQSEQLGIHNEYSSYTCQPCPIIRFWASLIFLLERDHCEEIVQPLCLPFFSWHGGNQAFHCCLVQSAFRKEPQLILCSSRLTSSVAVTVPRHLAAGPTMMQCNSA